MVVYGVLYHVSGLKKAMQLMKYYKTIFKHKNTLYVKCMRKNDKIVDCHSILRKKGKDKSVCIRQLLSANCMLHKLTATWFKWKGLPNTMRNMKWYKIYLKSSNLYCKFTLVHFGMNMSKQQYVTLLLNKVYMTYTCSWLWACV